jgi:hypothetical protein
VYPKKDEPLDVSRDDFTLIVGETETTAKPQSATVISAMLKPRKGSNGGVTSAANTGIGYESGTYTDPSTGQRVHVRSVTRSSRGR